jgi:hypothetical protein
VDDRQVNGTLDRCRVVTDWRGTVWRAHVHGLVRGTFRTGSDYQHTRRTSGRWHRGGPSIPESERFSALYASMLSHVAEAEFLRRLDHRRRAEGRRIDLREDRYRLSQLDLGPSRVFDLRDLSALGVTCRDVCQDDDYSVPQRLAAEAYRRGAEALLVWSCAVDPLCSHVNVIVFPDQFLPGSRMRESGVWSEIRPLP